ncbi:MAG: hypothetical protein QM764_21425 [Chitinophagaceae bacterium]
MFLNVDSADPRHLSLPRFYMSLMMIAPMALLMLVRMNKMYPDKTKNRLMGVSSINVFITALSLMRIQFPVTDIQYMKFENLEGPVYSVSKNQVVSIHYQNGTTDTFNTGPSDTVVPAVTKENFLTWIKGPGIAGCPDSNDPASVIHARNALKFITSWNIVDDKSRSQVILRFDFVGIGPGDKKGKAIFLDPTTNNGLFETRTVNTTMSCDMNTKMAVIDKICKNEIKKLVKE